MPYGIEVDFLESNVPLLRLGGVIPSVFVENMLSWLLP